VLDLRDFVGEPLDAVSPLPRAPERVRPLADAERDHLTLVLEHAGWRIEGVRGAARLLGLQPSTMRAKMRKLGIQRPVRTVETIGLSPT
jgi:transcriptional regulator with GAF, ATPase, and Fis domain